MEPGDAALIEAARKHWAADEDVEITLEAIQLGQRPAADLARRVNRLSRPSASMMQLSREAFGCRIWKRCR
jgi:hypothetical protein